MHVTHTKKKTGCVTSIFCPKSDLFRSPILNHMCAVIVSRCNFSEAAKKKRKSDVPFFINCFLNYFLFFSSSACVYLSNPDVERLLMLLVQFGRVSSSHCNSD